MGVEPYSNVMRWHELAVQNWLYSNFFVASGFPVPVVFTSPMDAFSSFKTLWASEQNPFKYLLDARDESGAPLYLPFPAPLRYPLISVHRRGWGTRASQNFSTFRSRYINWPTTSANPTRNDLGLVSTAHRPMGWDFKYQVDFFSTRPDTQAAFLHRLMQRFTQTGGATPRAWVKVNFPSYFGIQYEQMLLDGGQVTNMTPEEVPDGEMTEYRMSFNVTLEGWLPDLDVVEFPALWTVVLSATIPATPEQLAKTLGAVSFDLRKDGVNPIMAERANVPLTA